MLQDGAEHGRGRVAGETSAALPDPRHRPAVYQRRLAARGRHRGAAPRRGPPRHGRPPVNSIFFSLRSSRSWMMQRSTVVTFFV